MYDINKLRKELAESPKQLELLNLIHLQIANKQTNKKVTIIVPKSGYSQKIKKKIIHMMGYKIPYDKIYGDEILIIKQD
ncbi:MAG: hypothetical protein IKG42_01560 [Clostridia bacterium]|nr:hypothetical protein [Clostridia bacterium]